MKRVSISLLSVFISISAISQTTQIENQNKNVMTKYLLHGKLTAKEGYGEKLTSILLEASKLVSAAKGCILYVVSKDTTGRNSVWITEIWNSKEDHDNSLKGEGVKELISQAIPILDGQPQKGQELEILGGKGI
ncbi:MAG: antibiotic biosynthesis monooxygenase family protein [Parafilimonas sp.]